MPQFVRTPHPHKSELAAGFSLEPPCIPDEKQLARAPPMNLEPAPRLNKTPFIITAVICFAVMLLIGLLAPDKFATVPLLLAVVFLILSITAIMFPIIVDYAADSAEYVQQERERVAEQVQRLHHAGESLARAAAQIKAVEEAVHKTAHAAENLPYRMQEKLAEFNAALAEKEESDREALEEELAELRTNRSAQLKSAAEKIQQAAAAWTALEAKTRQQLSAAQAIAAQLDLKLTRTRDQPAPPAAPDPTPPPNPVIASSPTRPDPAEAPAPDQADPTEPAVEEVKPPKPRSVRKTKSELPAVAPSPSQEDAGEAAAVPAAADEPAAPTEASASSDGATRLLATAYIGIGNKLFIRGEGPGLSWDKGAPMQFVSIGKWGWASHEATRPVRAKLYKNDDTAAVSGEVVLEPGQHVEVTALF